MYFVIKSFTKLITFGYGHASSCLLDCPVGCLTIYLSYYLLYLKGYVVVEDFFDKKDLEACRKAIEDKVEQLAQKLLKGGKITSE